MQNVSSLSLSLSLSLSVYVCVLGAFRLGLRRIVQLRRECTEIKKYLREIQLAEHNIDATETGLPLHRYLQVYAHII